MGLPLAHREFLAIAQRQQPSLAAQRRHPPDMIHVDQRVSMYALEDRPPQAAVNMTERLGGQIPLPCGDDPDQLPLGLKRQDVVEIQQEVLLAGPANHLARPGRGGRFGGFDQPPEGLGHISRPAVQRPHAVESLGQPLLADGLQQIIQSSRFESADGVLVIRRDDDHDRQRAFGQPVDHVEAAQPRHLKIQQHQVRRELSDLRQSLFAILRFPYDGDVAEAAELLTENLAGDGFVIDDQRPDCWGSRHQWTVSLKTGCATGWMPPQAGDKSPRADGISAPPGLRFDYRPSHRG